LTDKLVPTLENPHEMHSVEEIYPESSQKKKERHDHTLLRIGLFSALAIAIHNFPEALATFTTALLQDTT
jgi:ZIP family zinc transporter